MGRRFEPRRWAIEGATGMGALLAQQLVGAGEHVVDVPPKLSARVRLMDTGRIDKTDPNDARSAAIVAVRNATLNSVGADSEDRVVLRLLADRYHQLTAQRTRSVCRLHALLCLLIEGGTGRSLNAARAVKLLASVAISDPIIVERVATCRQFVTELEALDQALVDIRARTVTAVDASKTTVIDMYGVGSIGAAIILGHSGDIRRFPTAGHYARHNGTAPLEASSGPKARHRLNPQGDRQINHAIHTAALTQIAHDHPGRVYYHASWPRARRTRKRSGPSSGASATSSTGSFSATPETNATATPGPAPIAAARPRAREDNAGTTLKSSVAGLAPHDSRLFG